MSQGHWIEALVALILWVLSPAIFFSRDLRRWWRTRDLRRARALEEVRQKAAAEARVREELAAKYPLPQAQRTPGSTG
jgi:hypothetical protein